MSRFKDTVLCAAIALSVVSLAYAQIGVSTVANLATKADLDALAATVPIAASMIPPTDNTTGAIGAVTNQFARPDAVRPARYRQSNCQLSGGTGQCTMTWSTPFAVTPAPLGDPTAINGSFATLQYNCNWIAPGPTTTGGTVGCRSSILGLAILGTIWTLLSNGTTVYGTAVQPL